ncbi:lim domain transcription factor [Lasius niger]|uniref:Lim domain transcription factor n=1 Tax=Lasius niger TaxID=67767 RepID=A0A0J7KS43_LASNI|nr:lim domain transcription factor [Lasius niger]
MFGSGGVCSSCGNAIPANELVMRAGESVFHLKCFNCNKCGGQLVSGDRYYLLSGSPVCESDWHKIVKSSGVAAAAAAAAGNSGAPVRKDGTCCASESGGPAIAPAGVRLSGLVALDPGYLRLKLLRRSRTESPKDFAMRKKKPCALRVRAFQENRKENRVNVAVPWDRHRCDSYQSSVSVYLAP